MEHLCSVALGNHYSYHDHSSKPIFNSTQKPDSVFTQKHEKFATFGNAILVAEIKAKFDEQKLDGLNELITRFRSIFSRQNQRETLFAIYGSLQKVCIFRISSKGLQVTSSLTFVDRYSLSLLIFAFFSFRFRFRFVFFFFSLPFFLFLYLFPGLFFIFFSFFER